MYCLFTNEWSALRRAVKKYNSENNINVGDGDPDDDYDHNRLSEGRVAPRAATSAAAAAASAAAAATYVPLKATSADVAAAVALADLTPRLVGDLRPAADADAILVRQPTVERVSDMPAPGRPVDALSSLIPVIAPCPHPYANLSLSNDMIKDQGAAVSRIRAGSLTAAEEWRAKYRDVLDVALAAVSDSKERSLLGLNSIHGIIHVRMCFALLGYYNAWTTFANRAAVCKLVRDALASSDPRVSGVVKKSPREASFVVDQMLREYLADGTNVFPCVALAQMEPVSEETLRVASDIIALENVLNLETRKYLKLKSGASAASS